MRYNLGDIPEWIGGCGTMLALGFAAFSYWNELRKRRSERRFEQARLLDAWITKAEALVLSVPDAAGGYPEEVVLFTTHVSNASAQSFRLVGITFTVGESVGSANVLHVVPPTGDRPIELSLGMTMPPEVDTSMTSEEILGMTNLDMSFTDASGNRCRRTAEGELQFLYSLAGRTVLG